MDIYSAGFPHGIVFHHFHDEMHQLSGQGSITPDQFEKILEYIGIERILEPEVWMCRLNQGSLGENDLCLTFDDGLRNQYDVCMPILEKSGLKAFWFVYSAVFKGEVDRLGVYSCFRTRFFGDIDEFYGLFFVKFEQKQIGTIDSDRFNDYYSERRSLFPFYSDNDLKFRFIRDLVLGTDQYNSVMDEIIEEEGIRVEDIAESLWLTDQHLKDLCGKGHMVGLHTYSHPTVLADLPFADQQEEYQRNYTHLKEVCGRNITSASHPCNSYNDSTLQILRDLGVFCAFRSNINPPDGGYVNQSPLEMVREDHTNVLKKIEDDISDGHISDN